MVMRRKGSRAPLLALLALVLAAPLAAQQDQITRAFDMERRGNYAGAADAYRAVLAERPADPGALLGLERALTALNRAGEIIPQVQAALDARPTSGAVYSVALRAWAAQNRPDSARKALDLWVVIQPNDEAPYREWANLALSRRDRQEARRTYQLARDRLGQPEALAAEVAQVAMLEEDFASAAREWSAAVRRSPGYRSNAVNVMSAAGERNRPSILRELAKEGSSEARQLQGSLEARWGQPVAGFRTLSAALPASNPQAIDILRHFLDVIQPLATREARQAQGLAYEAMATRTGGQQASRFRLDAARVYAEAGDGTSAHRMLSALAADPDAPRGVAADAGGTLVTVLLEEGKVEQASRELAQHRDAMPAEQYQALVRKLAVGWARAGDLDRADQVIAADSTVEGLDIAGRLKLFRGDLVAANTLLRSAGPFAGGRDESTSRTALLALLQPIEADSLPSLGAALLDLERRDSAKAISGLDQLADRLAPEAGGAELKLLVGRLQRARGQTVEAERSFRAAIAGGARPTTPAALLDLARLLADSGKNEQSVTLLEQVILEYPESAVTPQARRLLDEIRGAVPRT